MSEIDKLVSELFAKPSVSMERRGDGSIILRSNIKPGPAAANIGEWLRRWSAEDPDRPFLAERRGPDNDWFRISYGEVHCRIKRIGAWMLARKLSPQAPVAILSDNSIDHALLALAAAYTGIPCAAISPAYSLMSADHVKLTAMIELLNPGLIYVSDGVAYAKALSAINGHHEAVVVAGANGSSGVLTMDDLEAAADDGRVEAACDAVTGETIAKFLFTSGSTGAPKAVINTHGMLTSSQEAKVAIWTFLVKEPPVIVDWLPWSHTFGANHNFNMVLRNGGTLYIDAGRPAPHLAHITADNLKNVGPNICFNVPRGYAMLVDALRRDDELRRAFFANVRIIFYAAAALPQNLWDALDELSRATTGKPTPMVSAWGATETSPLSTDCHFQAERSGNIGVPAPGVELKLVPDGNKMEIRVRGPNVMPGYWKLPEATAAAFDEEGFYRIGDAVRMAEPDDPAKGLYFDGRVAEDFKLSTGTFVNVGQLRMEGIAALSPVAQDIVLCGHDSSEVGFLVFPDAAACRKIAGAGENEPLRKVLDSDAVRAHVAVGLANLKKSGGGSSRFATRARLLDQPPSVDDGEITDKGYINQRAVLDNRTDQVALLTGENRQQFITTD